MIGSTAKLHPVVRGAKIRTRSHSIGNDRNALVDLGEQLFTIAVIDVHNRDRLPFFLLVSKLCEELRFGIEVALHRAMKIEMILGEIGEDSDIPFKTAGAVLRERV